VAEGNGSRLERRVVRAAEAALAERRFVTAIDVLVGVGWLEPRRVDEWRQGRVPYLEAVVIASLGKVSSALEVFRRWGRARGLKPSETVYVSRSRGRRPLQFSKSGDPQIELAYRTHWVWIRRSAATGCTTRKRCSSSSASSFVARGARLHLDELAIRTNQIDHEPVDRHLQPVTRLRQYRLDRSMQRPFAHHPDVRHDAQARRALGTHPA
jgi:hypothetical protein